MTIFSKTASRIVSLLIVCSIGPLFMGCSSGLQGPIVLGSKVSETYTKPETYQAHRDQQLFFGEEEDRIAYTDTGKGRAIVLLHGVPTSSWMYRKVVPGLQQSMRVITIDLLGYGSSDKPEDNNSNYSAAAQAARVQALLKSLDVQQYGILLHDMGGLVAWEILRTSPEAITHVVALNTIVNQEGFNNPTMEPGTFTKTLMKAYTSGLTSSVILNKTFSDLGLKGEYKLTEAECEGYIIPMREGASPALYAFFTSINGEMMTQLDKNKSMMTSYKGKSLIMWGAKDETLTVKQVPILKDMLGTDEAKIHIYENNAHFLAEEIPEEIIRRVTALMSEG